MNEALRNADLRNIFVAAKRYSSRSVVVEIGSVVEKFASRYAELDLCGREEMRREYPGLVNKKYRYGWTGQWARLVDSDPEASGDNALSVRTVVRYLKFLPIAQELIQRDRLDAIPIKLGGPCPSIQRCLTLIDPPCGPASTETVRSQAIASVADAFVSVYESVARPINASVSHSHALDAAIIRACKVRGLEIGPPPAPKPSKRARAATSTNMDKDDAKGVDSRISSIVRDELVAREVTKRLMEMVPDIARNVERDLKSDDSPMASPVRPRNVLNHDAIAAMAKAAIPAVHDGKVTGSLPDDDGGGADNGGENGGEGGGETGGDGGSESGGNLGDDAMDSVSDDAESGGDAAGGDAASGDADGGSDAGASEGTFDGTEASEAGSP